MRIIIVGGGEVGYGLSQALAARHEVVVVDHAPQAGDRFEKLDVEFIAGGGTTAEVLRRAGVEQAQAFIACTGLDEVNIELIKFPEPEIIAVEIVVRRVVRVSPEVTEILH